MTAERLPTQLVARYRAAAPRIDAWIRDSGPVPIPRELIYARADMLAYIEARDLYDKATAAVRALPAGPERTAFLHARFEAARRVHDAWVKARHRASEARATAGVIENVANNHRWDERRQEYVDESDRATGHVANRVRAQASDDLDRLEADNRQADDLPGELRRRQYEAYAELEEIRGPQEAAERAEEARVTRQAQEDLTRDVRQAKAIAALALTQTNRGR